MPRTKSIKIFLDNNRTLLYNIAGAFGGESCHWLFHLWPSFFKEEHLPFPVLVFRLDLLDEPSQCPNLSCPLERSEGGRSGNEKLERQLGFSPRMVGLKPSPLCFLAGHEMNLVAILNSSDRLSLSAL
jgi:hypothetical protein